jgi:plasmid replication initiation protein
VKKADKAELEKVRKSNALMDGQYKHTLQEQRIILTILSKVGYDDDMNHWYRVKWSEILDATNGKIDTLNKIKDICQKLRKKDIWLDKNDHTTLFGFIAEARIFKNEGYVDFLLSPSMKEELLDLLNRGHFTLFNLQCVLSLPSVNSVRLYEILRSRSFMKMPVEIDLDDLKWSLGLSSDENYKNFAHFRLSILEKAKKDLARNTDIKFTFEAVKTSRRVTSIRFTITENKKWQPTLVSAIAKKEEPVRDFVRCGDIVLIGGDRVEVGLSVAEHKGRSFTVGQLTVMLKAGKISLVGENAIE